MTQTAIVIGAGVGGISAAIHLAHAGLHVSVVEKNARPGGRCERLSRDGHHFDTGPTLFVMPRLYEAEFAALGTSMQAQLDLLRVDPTYRLVFADGSQLALTSDMQAMQRQLEAMQAGSFPALQRYLQEGEQHFRLVLERLVERDFRSLLDVLNPSDLALVVRLKALTSHYRHMAAYFEEPRLKAAFTFQDIYMGLSPFEAPATYSMMPYTELVHGVYYPRGGMYSIVERLVELAGGAGVEFRYNTPVQHIETDEYAARGVRLSGGETLQADVLLANADLPYVYQKLLPDEATGRRLAHKRFSCSAISFFWGVDRRYETLGAHTLCIAGDYRGNFEGIQHGQGLPADPSLYVHAPARLDPAMAPPGQDTLVAIVPVGHLHTDGGQDWGRLREAARQHVFRRLRGLGVTDLEAHIKFEESFTPLSWARRYNLVNGSTHGLSHTLAQMACFRPANRHRRYHNLYFAGASTHPGTGLPTAMVSGRLAAQRILDEL